MRGLSSHAGGDGLANGVPLHKLTDLVVLAGMDPADSATQQLLAQLQQMKVGR